MMINKDLTGLYILGIVAVVAIVGIVVLVINSGTGVSTVSSTESDAALAGEAWAKSIGISSGSSSTSSPPPATDFFDPIQNNLTPLDSEGEYVGSDSGYDLETDAFTINDWCNEVRQSCQITASKDISSDEYKDCVKGRGKGLC